PAGVLCCGVADGHRTAWEIRRGGYFIPNPIDPAGEWVQVPPGAVVHNASNPVGEAIVWWNAVPVDDDNETRIFIRCFVPGDGPGALRAAGAIWKTTSGNAWGHTR